MKNLLRAGISRNLLGQITGYNPGQNMRDIVATTKQQAMPTTVGNANATAVHFLLWLSFLMVRQVVEQGQCIKQNSMVHTAVSQVHPLSTNRVLSSTKLLISVSAPVAIYAMKMCIRDRS